MTDRRALGRAGESAVGDERDARGQPHATDRRSRREHLAHARPALGTFVAD